MKFSVIGLTALTAVTVGAVMLLKDDQKNMKKVSRAVSKAVDDTVSSVKSTANKITNNVNNMKTY